MSYFESSNIILTLSVAFVCLSVIYIFVLWREKKNGDYFYVIALPLAIVIVLILWMAINAMVNDSSKYVNKKEVGEPMTLMVGEEMRSSAIKGYTGFRFVGKLPNVDCAQFTTSSLKSGLWAYLGKRFKIGSLVFRVESLNEEFVTLILLEE